MGALGVSIGAFGAHALKSIIEKTDQIAVWNTGMRYFWIHVLAMLVIAFACRSTKVTQTTTWIWLLSIGVFSGSLFALSLGAPRIIGAFTPIGGIGFIAGWLLLLQLKKEDLTD